MSTLNDQQHCCKVPDDVLFVLDWPLPDPQHSEVKHDAQRYSALLAEIQAECLEDVDREAAQLALLHAERAGRANLGGTAPKRTVLRHARSRTPRKTRRARMATAAQSRDGEPPPPTGTARRARCADSLSTSIISFHRHSGAL